jgi:hypothetical protein
MFWRPFMQFVDFLQCFPPSWMQEKSSKLSLSLAIFEQFSGSQAAFGTIVSAICGYQEAGTSSLN